MRSHGLPLIPLLAATLAAAVLPHRAVAQDEAVVAYYRGIADHFGLPASEVRVLADWRVGAEEVPVILFVARHAGISADALVALKRGGRTWTELARRYDVGPGTFHVPLPPSASAGPLSRAYGWFRETPSGGWDEIPLDDGELIQLVNLRVLSEHLDVPPARVLEVRQREGSFVAAYGALVRAAG